MTIILMRHGKPDHPVSGRFTARALADWCEGYDLADICDSPPPRSMAIARMARVIASSPLPRARSSLTRLGLQPHEVDEVFSEVAMPLLPFERLHLPLTVWLALLRLLWLCGYAGHVESLLMPEHGRVRRQISWSRYQNRERCYWWGTAS